MKTLRTWWHAENKTMTTLCDDGEGETYTNGEIVTSYTFFIIAAFLIGIAC